ncbi:hypothetical protein BDA99DRAFT_317307 [Phascolomyces articulosus]|uniref:F-box domain-containing protein n=1 Tax=Phascolomyces articulosus TaxID=60185 RepID=A0AAD5P6Z5_9FUNG|nr:hypothetical protein BDA99DRAFT_317307 [Phascolomyces articulosus]
MSPLFRFSTMVNFITILPQEIISAIFLHLDQSDCIECMHVCRQWFTSIPNFTTALWTKLIISTNAWKTTNDCLLSCLGPHVQHVSIIGLNISNIWKTLINKGCSITSLDIKSSKGYWGVDDNDDRNNNETVTKELLYPSDFRLLFSLEQFSGTMTKLSITNHTSYITPQRILKCLPALTHFTLTFGDLKSDPINTTVAIFRSNIVYLHLDMLCSARPSFNTLLHCCRKLQWLIMEPHASRYYDSFCDELNFYHLMLLCPYLTFIRWANPGRRTSDSHYWDILQSSSMNNDNKIYKPLNPDKKLRYITLEADKETVNTTLHDLATYQESIEYLEVGFPLKDECHWDRLLPLRFPQLKQLCLPDITVIDTERIYQWTQFFSNCQNLEQIQMLVNLEDGEHEVSPEVTVAFYNTISQLKHLKRFESDLWPSRIQHVDIGHFICRNTCLTYLELANTCFSDAGFVALTELPCLKYLALHMEDKHTGCVSTDALLEFADKLSTKSASCNTCLTTLKLYYMSNLNDDVRVRVSKISSLTDLTMIKGKQHGTVLLAME